MNFAIDSPSKNFWLFSEISLGNLVNRIIGKAYDGGWGSIPGIKIKNPVHNANKKGAKKTPNTKFRTGDDCMFFKSKPKTKNNTGIGKKEAKDLAKLAKKLDRKSVV